MESLFNSSIHTLTEVVNTLKTLRLQLTKEEYEIHRDIQSKLDSGNISYQYEYKLGPRNRIDFLVDGGVGIEVKKRRPNRTSLLKQLTRYCEFEQIESIVVVTGKSLPLPESLNGKPIKVISLNQLWGIASS